MKLSWVPFWVAGAVLLAVIVSLPPDGFFSADAGPKYWQALAFAEGGGRLRTFDYPGAGLDPRFRHVPMFTIELDGRLASAYPVVFPMVVSIPLWLFGDPAVRMIPWLAGLAAAWAAGLMASRLGGREVTGPAAAMVLAATPLAFYSVAFWEHSLAAFLVTAGMLVVVGGNRSAGIGSLRWAILAVALGLGAWVRTEVALLAPILGLAVVLAGPGRRAAAAGWVAAGLGAGWTLGASLQFLALGRWLPLHVSYHAESSFATYPFLTSRVESVFRFLAPHWTAGVAVLVWLAAVSAVLTRRGSRSDVGLGLGIAAIGCSLVAATVVPGMRWLEGTRPTEAFPYASPAATWIILAALPVMLWGQDRTVILDRRRVIPVLVAAWLPVAVLLARPVRSFEWGGRLFLPSVVILVAVMWSLPGPDGRWSSLRRSAVLAAASVAVCVQVGGLVLIRHSTAIHGEMAAEVAAFTEAGEPVITDAYMVPLLSGREWFDRRFIYCTTQPNLPRLSARIRSEGTDRWTFATVVGAPEAGLVIGERLLDASGGIWTASEHRDVQIRSQTLRLTRYRRIESSE